MNEKLTEHSRHRLVLLGLPSWLSMLGLNSFLHGGLRIDFTAEELKQRTPTVTGFLMMGLNLRFMLVTTATFDWVMVRMFPDSHAVLPIQTLARYPVVG